jgi:hypothetical protein
MNLLTRSVVEGHVDPQCTGHTDDALTKDNSLKKPKGVIRIRMSKDRQHNGQKQLQKDKQRSTKHTHKTKDRELYSISPHKHSNNVFIKLNYTKLKLNNSMQSYLLFVTLQYKV